MNNIDSIKNQATSFFQKLPAYLVLGVRYIVFIGRKFPLIAAGFLLFYAFFFYQLFLNRPSLKSQLPPPPQPYSASTSSPSYNKPVPTAPVIDVAQASAFKNGAVVTIRWTKPVEYPQIYSANGKLEANCQPRSCDINLSQQQTDRLEVKWRQQGQRFEKVFRF